METGQVKEIYLRRVGWNGVSPPTPAQLREARILQELDQLTGRAVPTVPSVAGIPRLPAPVVLQVPSPQGRPPLPFPTLSTNAAPVEPRLSPAFRLPTTPLMPDLQVEPEPPRLPFEIVPQDIAPLTTGGTPSSMPSLPRLPSWLSWRGILDWFNRDAPRPSSINPPPSLMPVIPMEDWIPIPPRPPAEQRAQETPEQPQEDEKPQEEKPQERREQMPLPPAPPVAAPVARGGSGRVAAVMPNIPAPNWDAVREMFRKAAPTPPDTDPREKWIIGLIGAMLGAQQNPGERLGAMFARMAGAGAQAGINVRREDRAREDAFRKEAQQHLMNLASLEAKIAESEWARLFNQWKAAEQFAIEREKLDVMRETAGLRAALIAATMGSNITPEMLLSGVVDRAASGQLLIPGLPPEAIREQALKLLEQRDKRAATLLRSNVVSNPVLQGAYDSAVRQVIINHLATMPAEKRMQILNAYRGALESRPRPGRIPEFMVNEPAW